MTTQSKHPRYVISTRERTFLLADDEDAFAECDRCGGHGWVVVASHHVGGGAYNDDLGYCPRCYGGGERKVARRAPDGVLIFRSVADAEAFIGRMGESDWAELALSPGALVAVDLDEAARS